MKDLKNIPAVFGKKLLRAIELLKTDPFRGKKLQGRLSGIYSLRVWPYRILYEVHRQEILVIVLHIGQRQGVYKK